MSAQFALQMCAKAENCKKNTKTSYFESSRSFKVIDIDSIKKLVTTSVCYDMQYVCAYLHLFLR